MKKYLLFAMALLLISIPCVMAPTTGGLRIDPFWPEAMTTPTAEFTIWCQTGSSWDVEVLLVMTAECLAARTSDTDVVTVLPEGFPLVHFDYGDFVGVTGMGGVYVPDTGATTGARYLVSSLKDHLDYGLSTPLVSGDTIYWAMKPLGYDPLTTNKTLTVTLNSGDPRMLIYLMGKSENDATLLDMRVPPTQPGFMVPEVVIGTIVTVAAMFGALGLFALKKKRISTK